MLLIAKLPVEPRGQLESARAARSEDWTDPPLIHRAGVETQSGLQKEYRGGLRSQGELSVSGLETLMINI